MQQTKSGLILATSADLGRDKLLKKAGAREVEVQIPAPVMRQIMAYGGRNALDIMVAKLDEIDTLFSSWELVKRDPKTTTADARKALKKAVARFRVLRVEAEKARQMLPEPPVGIRPSGGAPAKNAETRPAPAVAAAETRGAE